MNSCIAGAIGFVIGLLPGAIFLALSVPIRGEAELTVGVIGLWMMPIGGLAGLIGGYRWSKPSDENLTPR